MAGQKNAFRKIFFNSNCMKWNVRTTRRWARIDWSFAEVQRNKRVRRFRTWARSEKNWFTRFALGNQQSTARGRETKTKNNTETISIAEIPFVARQNCSFIWLARSIQSHLSLAFCALSLTIRFCFGLISKRYFHFNFVFSLARLMDVDSAFANVDDVSTDRTIDRSMDRPRINTKWRWHLQQNERKKCARIQQKCNHFVKLQVSISSSDCNKSIAGDVQSSEMFEIRMMRFDDDVFPPHNDWPLGGLFEVRTKMAREYFKNANTTQFHWIIKMFFGFFISSFRRFLLPLICTQSMLLILFRVREEFFDDRFQW